MGEFYIDKKRCPDSSAEAGLDEAPAGTYRYVESVAIEPDCVIVATLAHSEKVRSSLRGQRVEMKGRRDSNGLLDWTCGGTVAPELLPSACRK